MGHLGPTAIGFSLPLSAPRRLVNDLLHFARRVPTVPVQREMDVRRLVAARERGVSRIGWAAIFTKAYARVCSDRPPLRPAYLGLPRPRLYEHPVPVASVAVEREYAGEPGVFFYQVPSPDGMPLAELEAELQRAKTAAVEDAFAFQLWFARLPQAVRRGLWWWALTARGGRKAQFLGTFGVTAYSALGAESLHPLSPLTTTLSYGVIDPAGRVTVRLVYDHRALDGATIARALADLQDVLAGPIADELDARSR